MIVRIVRSQKPQTVHTSQCVYCSQRYSFRRALARDPWSERCAARQLAPPRCARCCTTLMLSARGRGRALAPHRRAPMPINLPHAPSSISNPPLLGVVCMGQNSTRIMRRPNRSRWTATRTRRAPPSRSARPTGAPRQAPRLRTGSTDSYFTGRTLEATIGLQMEHASQLVSIVLVVRLRDVMGMRTIWIEIHVATLQNNITLPWRGRGRQRRGFADMNSSTRPTRQAL